MYKRINLAVALCLILAVCFCAFPAMAAEKAQKAKWTFMVYLNSDNELDGYADWEIGDVAEMKRIGSSPDVNIVVFHDRKGVGAMKLFIKKGEVQILEKLGKVDSGDYRELIKFGQWAVANYPAEHYVMDIWDHGTGWSKKAKKSSRGISYDYDSGNNMDTPQLGEAMKQIALAAGQNIDIFGMDACNMQMIEVAYEVKDCVNYIVASEESEPANGWAYNLLLKPLVENPAVAPVDFAKIMVDSYYQSYCHSYRPVTLSALDCSKLDALREKIDALAVALIEKMDSSEVPLTIKKAFAAENVMHYDTDICDLVHFCQYLNANITDAKINQAADELIMMAVSSPSKAVICNIHLQDYEENSNGISIYLPSYSFMSLSYKKIKFGSTMWTKFIEAYAAVLNI